MKAKKTKRARPRMPLASEEMKQWSAMLGNELSTLPKVTARPMFGLRGFYRGKKIFAALPVTRGIRNPNALIFRIQPMPAHLLERAKQEPRIDTENGIPSAKWFTFELHSEADFRDALWWLNQAYEHAK
ncbi:MAG TPA: hypothetical protein VNY81_05805 [Candidatus Saccharimonadales bacterium]|jgi:hypothetical protein|nr:hypothetical protein [Candidatus Saccharimonadales bacterium]